MDKFAVDLEKVLDEFEYNEGREEPIIQSVIKTHSLPHISQKPLRPPAASYRRPPFEPVNLADADFAAANIPSPRQYNLLKQKNNNYKEQFQNAKTNSYQEFTSTSSKFSEDNTQSITQTNEYIEDSSDGAANLSERLSIKSDVSQTEDTPDLLDSNILKPLQTNQNFNEDSDVNTQLPDVTTSIRSVSHTSVLPCEPEPVFDLIKPNVSSNNNNNNVLNDLPPVVEMGSIIKDGLPDLRIEPITFDCDDNVSESELEEYLKSLEENEVIQIIQEEAPCDVSLNSNSELKIETKTVYTISNVNPEEAYKEHEPECQISSSDQHYQPIEETSRSNNEFYNEQPIVTSLKSEEEVVVAPKFPVPDEIIQTNLKVEEINEERHETDVVDEIIVDRDVSEVVEDIEIPAPEVFSHENCSLTPSGISVVTAEEAVVEKEELENAQNEENSMRWGEERSQVSPEEEQGRWEEGSPDEESRRWDEDHSQVSPDEAEVCYDCSEDDNYEHSDMSCEKASRPNSLVLASHLANDNEETPTPTNTGGVCDPTMNSADRLGKVAPYWVPDTDTEVCMQCFSKFTVIRRRHHCRACGHVLCSKCSNAKAPLEYMDYAEARVCQPCFKIIYRVSAEDDRYNLGRQPNPNNPMEYCSTIPPLQQAASSLMQPPPSVLVPTGVLKREGRSKSDVPKQVIFSDGIRPGGDLTELDGSSEPRVIPRRGRRVVGKSLDMTGRRGLDPDMRPDPITDSLIPPDPDLLPPVVVVENGNLLFCDEVSRIDNTPVKFAVNYNLFVLVKRVKLECCVNRDCWSICSEGLACVGQDEVALVLECLQDEALPPQDVFHLVHSLYMSASKGTTVTEMSFTPSFSQNLLGSKDHGGFLYIRPTFQCVNNLLLPPQPYLIAILVHRWETPWARLFPLRLVLRLGAEYRYYPCPLFSIRHRHTLYTDIGHTVMNLLVDFKKYSYSLPTFRGLVIHMEDRETSILFPRNRYDQVLRALNNSNDSVLAFGANLSLVADSHLVCIQGTKDENVYHTQAINIHTKPRKVTGASFVVFNGALKVAGLSGKSRIMEDGLMVHLPSESMVALRTALKEMRNYEISCGPNDEEKVLIKWVSEDTNFNIGVKSCIDKKPFDGVPSIRVHNGTDYTGSKKLIRWTEVFILETEDENSRANDPLDVKRISEQLAKATCEALVPVLDSLSKSNHNTLAIRATIHPDNVGYEAGSGGEKLAPVFMNRLDNELIPVLHLAAFNSQETPAVLELVFRVMNLP